MEVGRGGLIMLRIRKVTSWRLGSFYLIIHLICVWKLGTWFCSVGALSIF